jgi:CBS domain-containing protein
MSTPLLAVGTEATIDEVVDLMLSKNISSVPVVETGKLTGVVTRSSLIKSL